MKLKNLLMIIILSFLIISPIVAERTPEETIELLVNILEETNDTLIEVTNELKASNSENKALKEENKELEERNAELEKKNEALKESITKLKDALEESNALLKELQGTGDKKNDCEELESENKDLKASNDKLIMRLEESTALIRELKKRIEEDQIEIQKLRDQIEKNDNVNTNEKIIGVMINYTQQIFPELKHGIGMDINFFIPNLPFYFQIGALYDTSFNVSLGAGMRF